MISETPISTGSRRYKQSILKFVVLVCILTLSYACLVPTAYRSEESNVEPTSKDIIGLWSRSPCNPPDSDITHEQSLCTWEFKEDGLFEMMDVPEWSMSGEWDRLVNSGEGTWEIKRDPQGYWILYLRFNRLNGSRVSETYRDLYIYPKNSEFILFVYIGDGDSGRTMVFDKQD